MQKMKFAKAKLLAVMLACLTMVLALPMTAQAEVTMNILSPTWFPNCEVDDEEDSQTLWSNCVEEYIEWSVSGNLPEGYRIEKKEYESILYYTPATSGKYNFTITVKGKAGTDLEGKSCSRAYTLIIEPEGGCKHDNTTYPMEKINGTTASCQKDGRDTYWHCNFCEKDFLAADGTSEFWHDMEIVTGKNHTDSNNDGKCDDCGKAMPVFKKVTKDKEIVFGGSYVFVTKIGEQYYVLTEPEYKSYSEGEGAYVYDDIMSAKPVALNSNGTLDYATVATNKAMITRTDFAAFCPDLDSKAAMPRYGLSTILGGHRYTLTGEMGPFMAYAESSKYGNYIVLGESGAKLGSVYSWEESGGKGGGSAFLNAFKATKGDDTMVFFGFNDVSDFDYYVNDSDSVLYGYTMDSDTHPVYLYKMVFPGTVGTNSYTVSDGWDNVTAGDSTAGGVELSNVVGLTNAVNSDKINTAINTAIGSESVSGELVVTLTGDINVKSTADGAITYSVSPALAVVDNSGTPVGSSVKIDNDSLNGTPITVTLNTDGVEPNQIVHDLSDGSKEFYYPEETAEAGQQTFAIEQTGEGGAGETFVTFTTTSFSDFRILTTPEADTTPKPTKPALTAAAFTFTAPTLTYNADDKAQTIKAAVVAKTGVGTVTVTVKQNGTSVSEVKNAGEYKVYVSATEGDGYAAGSDIELGTVTIAKAKVTGTPKYTAISAADKTLADAGLTLKDSNITVPGAISWVDDNDDELPGTTVVAANTSYKWLFVPTDTVNYENLSGTIELWSKSSGSGGGGGGGSSSSKKNNTTKKDDVKTEDKVEENEQKTDDKTNGTAQTFGDVANNAYYADAVAWAVENGITTGTTANEFGPDDVCTRAQIVTFLWRAAGEPEVSTTVSFADVSPDDYFAKAVAWAVEKGITNGIDDQTFAPHQTCTRAEAVTFLWRATGKLEVDGDVAFDDVSAEAWFAAAVKWAENSEITGGIGDNLFGADDECTRAQIVTFLFRSAE